MKKLEDGERKRKSVEQEQRDLEHQLQIYRGSETEAAYRELERKRKKCVKTLKTLSIGLKKEELMRRGKHRELEEKISRISAEVEEVEKRIMETVAEESRVQALIDDQYVRLEMRGKAYMDAIRMSCRNIFYSVMEIFRPMYNNYRDDHVILRELTRSMGIIQKRDGMIDCQPLLAIEFQPGVRRLVSEFLERISEYINEYFAGRYLPIQIRLSENQSDIFG